MTVVVDLGCCDWGEKSVSIEPLIERFRPERLYGFDPYPHYGERQWEHEGCVVSTTRAAAWTRAGTVTFEPDSTRSHVCGIGTRHAVQVQCFDLAEYVASFPEPVIVKMDVEGSEHVLIPHLIATGAIENVGLLLVEFHGNYGGPPLTCPWELWS